MKLKYYGHACFSLAYEGGPTLVTDPFDQSVTYPPCDAACDAALVSHDHFDHNHIQSLHGDFSVIRNAGEYSVGGVQISAMPCFHDDRQGTLRGGNLLFRIEGEGMRIAHLGDLGHMPDEAQAAFLQGLDVMLLPIGGTYTIDSMQAAELISLFKPRTAIAMHFKTAAYPTINITTPDEFIAATQAVRMPRELRLSKACLAALPPVMVLDYK